MAAGAPEAQFCVVPKEDRAVPMLERVASELVSATEALAREDLDLRSRSGESIRMHFSVIVTTARLKVCMFDPARVNLTDGTTAEARFEDTPVVLFCKQLSTSFQKLVAGQSMNAKQVAAAKEHSVFVVNADAMHDFLVDFDVMDDSIRQLRFNRR
jgi:hypothetical protein